MTIRVEHADMLEAIPRLVAEGVACDAVVCDPPYGLEFMGADWDKLDGGLPQESVWKGRRGKGGSSIGDDDATPASRHHVGFGSSRAGFKRCTICGKRAFSGSPCRCETPAWVTEYPDGPPSSAIRMQRWHEQWAREAIKILRPGGFLLAFGGTRTAHRLVCGLEDAGFVIQDTIAWLYATGFPKNKAHLKPAYEPIVLAYKPGGKRTMQIDESRILPLGAASENSSDSIAPWHISDPRCCIPNILHVWAECGSPPTLPLSNDDGCGRSWSLTSGFPGDCPSCCRSRDALIQMFAANARGSAPLRPDALSDIDRRRREWSHIRENLCISHRATWDDFLGSVLCCTYSANLHAPQRKRHGGGVGGTWSEFTKSTADDKHELPPGRWPANVCHDGSDEVLAAFPESGGRPVLETEKHTYERSVRQFNALGHACPTASTTYYADNDSSAARFFFSAKAGAQDRWGSRHPTVKPVELMKWLVALVTPPGGTCIDPFAGSGTTGVAALATGRNAILIEREDAYVADIRERMAHYEGGGRHSLASKARQAKPRGETPLFDRPDDATADAITEAAQ